MEGCWGGVESSNITTHPSPSPSRLRRGVPCQSVERLPAARDAPAQRTNRGGHARLDFTILPLLIPLMLKRPLARQHHRDVGLVAASMTSQSRIDPPGWTAARCPAGFDVHAVPKGEERIRNHGRALEARLGFLGQGIDLVLVLLRAFAFSMASSSSL